MIYIELWRCFACQRILGRELRIGAGSFVSAVCWGDGCGEMNALTGKVEDRPTGGYVFAGEGAQEMADVFKARLESTTRKGKREAG